MGKGQGLLHASSWLLQDRPLMIMADTKGQCHKVSSRECILGSAGCIALSVLLLITASSSTSTMLGNMGTSATALLPGHTHTLVLCCCHSAECNAVRCPNTGTSCCDASVSRTRLSLTLPLTVCCGCCLPCSCPGPPSTACAAAGGCARRWRRLRPTRTTSWMFPTSCCCM